MCYVTFGTVSGNLLGNGIGNVSNNLGFTIAQCTRRCKSFFYFPFNFCHYTTILFYNFMHMLQLLFLLFKNAEGIVGKSVELYGWGDVEKKA